MKFLFTLILLFSFQAFAKNLTLNEILEREQRPTIKEILPFVDKAQWEGIPLTAEAASGFFDSRIDVPTWLGVLEESGPRLIAAMEKSFPGATWGFMGRDAMAIADMVEAFYLHIGQRNRVQRLGVSKASFANTTQETYIDFLRTHGLTIESTRNHPYIFIDPVSGGFGRQGRQLIASFYRHYIKAGKDPYELIGRVNMLGLIVSTFKGRPNDFKDSGTFFNRSARALDQNTSADLRFFFDNHRVMTYPLQNNAANEAGYTHFIGAWHESYGPMYQDPTTGDTLAVRGEVFPIEMRKTVLWTQAQIVRFAMNDDFVAQVQNEAQKLGYQFPMKRPKTSAEYFRRVRAYRLLSEEAFMKSIDPNEVARHDRAYRNFVNQESSSGLRFRLHDLIVAANDFIKTLDNPSPDYRLFIRLRFLSEMMRSFNLNTDIDLNKGQAFIDMISDGKWSKESIVYLHSLKNQIPNFDEMFDSQMPVNPKGALKQYVDFKFVGQKCLDLLD